MANTILTPQVIANELLMRMQNNLSFTGSVRHDYDDQFANKGAKVGDTYNLRVPVRFSATQGAAISVQDVTELKVPLTISEEYHVAFEFTAKDMTLSIDRFGDRYLDSAAVAIANTLDVSGLTMAYQATANAVGTPGTIPNTLKTYLSAGAKLHKGGCPVDPKKRYAVISPDMEVEIIDALKGLQNDQKTISDQFVGAQMKVAAGMRWMMDQNVRIHQVGPLGGTPLVNGAAQTGASLVTDGWTAAAAQRLKKGDVFTIAGVFAVNPVSGDTLQDLQQFTVTANVNSDGTGNATIPISPSIVATGASKTVSATPADNAAITVLGAANTLSPQGLVFHQDAFVFAMAPKELPQGVHMAARAFDKQTGMTLRVVSDYDISTDKFITRVDAMWGWAAPLPQFACRVVS